MIRICNISIRAKQDLAWSSFDQSAVEPVEGNSGLNLQVYVEPNGTRRLHTPTIDGSDNSSI